MAVFDWDGNGYLSCMSDSQYDELPTQKIVPGMGDVFVPDDEGLTAPEVPPDEDEELRSRKQADEGLIRE